MVKSANDMAVLLAEGVSGSVEGFANDMNAAARRLGMTQTSYVNPNGLPADGQITSARDLGDPGARDHSRPAGIRIFLASLKKARHKIRSPRDAQYNKLIDLYPGADGMKTGFICASGFNLVASATRDNRRLIAVVLGSPSASVRPTRQPKMLEQGFNGNGLSVVDADPRKRSTRSKGDRCGAAQSARRNLWRPPLASGRRRRRESSLEPKTTALAVLPWPSCCRVCGRASKGRCSGRVWRRCRRSTSSSARSDRRPQRPPRPESQIVPVKARQERRQGKNPK